jgi:hypothetical protein
VSLDCSNASLKLNARHTFSETDDWAKIIVQDTGKISPLTYPQGLSPVFEFKIDGSGPGSRRGEFMRTLLSEMKRCQAGMTPASKVSQQPQSNQLRFLHESGFV